MQLILNPCQGLSALSSLLASLLARWTQSQKISPRGDIPNCLRSTHAGSLPGVRRGRSDVRGAALLETSLVIVLSTVLVVTIIELGLLFFRYSILSHVAAVTVRKVAVDTAGLTIAKTSALGFNTSSCQGRLKTYTENKAKLLYKSLLGADWPASSPPVASLHKSVITHDKGAAGTLDVPVPILVLEASLPFRCLACRLIPQSISLNVRVEAPIEEECFEYGTCLP